MGMKKPASKKAKMEKETGEVSSFEGDLALVPANKAAKDTDKEQDEDKQKSAEEGEADDAPPEDEGTEKPSKTPEKVQAKNLQPKGANQVLFRRSQNQNQDQKARAKQPPRRPIRRQPKKSKQTPRRAATRKAEKERPCTRKQPSGKTLHCKTMQVKKAVP